MKQNILLKNLLLSAAAALALAASARAGGLPEAAAPAEASTPVHQGLLGQQYANLTYSFIDLKGPVNADNFQFAFNQPLNTGLDGVFAYDWTQAGLNNGLRENTQSLTAALRAFTTTSSWAKPYVEAGAGYAWQRQTPTGRHTSILWEAAVGAEFQVLPALTLTPYVQYTDAHDFADRHVWSGGVKANYWVDSQWAITAGFARDDNHTNRLTIGTNFRF